MNVLVVDDEPIARRVAAHTLQQAGYDLALAEDVRYVLAILARGEQQVVVSVWKMPGMVSGQL